MRVCQVEYTTLTSLYVWQCHDITRFKADGCFAQRQITRNQLNGIAESSNAVHEGAQAVGRSASKEEPHIGQDSTERRYGIEQVVETLVRPYEAKEQDDW
jgi:hypothetical protein